MQTSGLSALQARAGLSQPTLLIMARAPRAGRCNTRLAGLLSQRGAARLQALLLRQRLRLATATGLATEIHGVPDTRHPAFLAFRRAGVTVRTQRGRDLGARMRHAQGRRNGPVIFLGTDCPALAPRNVLAAADELGTHDAVCIPALDGGYVLLGLHPAGVGLLAGIDWGSARVMRQTRRQARRLGLSLRELPPLPDLDLPADYRRERRAGRLPACTPRCTV